jgi:hypothetical protein
VTVITIHPSFPAYDTAWPLAGFTWPVLLYSNLYAMEKRVFENPDIKDKVTLLESSLATG